jgi:peptide/nickel transport system permease protein
MASVPTAEASGLDRTGPRNKHYLWILKRLLVCLITLFVVSILVFGATQALPGDVTTAILKGDATPERQAALRDQLGLDEPLLEQYTSWLGGVLTGDLGDSLASRTPVRELVGPRLVNTAGLIGATLLISLPVALILGGWTSLKRDSWFDHVTQTSNLVAAAVPEFVVGILLVLLLSTGVFHLFPAVSEIVPGETILGHPTSVVLPALSLAIAVVPYLIRLLRGSLIEALESDYAEMATLKGLGTRRIVLAHSLPNALPAGIQGTAVVIAYLAGQVVTIEYLFNYPGLGSALTDAVANRDLPVVQAIVLMLAALIVVCNLLADVITVFVSPRARTALQ